jgi:DNA gyrase/topoisomerase IV subunit A
MENKTNIKQALFEACIKAQEKIIANAKEVIEEASESANDYTDTEEEAFDAYREQLQQRKDMYTTQILAARNDLDYLRGINFDMKDVIEEGAVIVTNTQNFFIAISLGKLEAEGKNFFAISISAPIYQVMAGLKAGDSFHFRDRDYKIVEIF